MGEVPRRGGGVSKDSKEHDTPPSLRDTQPPLTSPVIGGEQLC